MKDYFIEPEAVGGKMYWMIYRRFLGIKIFLERWNSQSSARNRIRELRETK